MPGYMEMAGNESGRDWVGAIRDMEIKEDMQNSVISLCSFA